MQRPNKIHKMKAVITVVAAKAARLILSVLVLTASLGLCSACATPPADVAAVHKCCSHKQDHKLPENPVPKECQNFRLDSSLAERPSAGSVVVHSIQYAVSPVPFADLVLPGSWDKAVALTSAAIPDHPGSSYRILLL
jgi:hypothetical protein